MRKGIAPEANVATQPAATPVSIGSASSNQRIGRQIAPKPPPPPEPSRIITSQAAPAPVLLSSSGMPMGEGFRRGLVGADGTPTVMMGPSEECTEKCPRCEKMVPPKAMMDMTKNTETGNVPRVCASCAQHVFKNPYDPKGDRWRPTMPRVRFDQENGRPYDTQERGVDMGYVLNRDTFHTREEAEQVDQKTGMSLERLRDGHVAGNWSGGGNVGHRVGARRR